MSTRRVLFIDDEESVLISMSRYFKKLGYQVFTAASGREGVKAFHRTRPDVTVVDLNMPDLSGFHVLEELRPKRPAIIMLTGNGEIENAVEAMRRGAENFLVKPVDMSHLEMAVEKAAEKAALYRENKTLRDRVTLSPKRLIIRTAVLLALVGASTVLGSLIGGGTDAPRSVPIRVPFNPQDTIQEIVEVPFRPIPNPQTLEQLQRNR